MFSYTPPPMIMFPLVQQPIQWKPRDITFDSTSLYESLKGNEKMFADRIMETMYLIDYYPLVPVTPRKPSENVLKTIKMLKETQHG